MISSNSSVQFAGSLAIVTAAYEVMWLAFLMAALASAALVYLALFATNMFL